MMNKIKLGILGVGNIGSSHLKLIIGGECPEITLAAVCDRKPERLEWAKKTAGEELPSFTDAEEMMDSGLCDSILVAVPHYDHPKFAMMAMKKGLHVLIEKPAGVYTKQVLEMNECAKAHNVVFGIMMNQRTNCIYRKMREIVKSGEMGAIKRTNWIITDWYRPKAYYDSGDWRATWSGEGGGVLLNQCPHNLDLWQWICGMPKTVRAHLHFGKWHDIEVEDDVTAYVEYENGATGVFITTTGDAPGTNRFEITLEKGKLIERLKKVIPIITPLLSNALDISDQIALSMEARAFGSGNKNKFVKPNSMNYGVAMGVIAILALIVLMIVAAGLWGFGIM